MERDEREDARSAGEGNAHAFGAFTATVIKAGARP
jgi:hypothetical protein